LTQLSTSESEVWGNVNVFLLKGKMAYILGLNDHWCLMLALAWEFWPDSIGHFWTNEFQECENSSLPLGKSRTVADSRLVLLCDISVLFLVTAEGANGNNSPAPATAILLILTLSKKWFIVVDE